ncbi:MAG: hypothetical protein WDO14_20335 [Bacteroidota bacterium]
MRDVQATLDKQRKKVDWTSEEGAFVIWISDDLNDIIKVNDLSEFTVTNYHHVSRLGFLIEKGIIDYDESKDLLIDGLNRVSGRTTTLPNSEPAPFLQDAIALLGLALGAKRVGGNIHARVLQWLKGFVIPSDKKAPGWKRIFYSMMLSLLDEKLDNREIQDLTDYPDVQLALIAKGLGSPDNVDLSRAYQVCCQKALTEDSDPAIAACRLTALNYLTIALPRISITSPTVQQLIEFLNKIPSGLKRWPWEDKPKTRTGSIQKWDIQNEYHVQSLVYSLLAPIFPDIEDEFYFEPVGQLNPRADIGIPSLSLIVEIKFLRSGASFSKLVEEIAADASLYFKKDSVYAKKYSQMIIFLWDNSARTQNHHEFQKGVSQLVNVAGSVVVSRPGNMTNQTIAQKVGRK